jgi:hypothetical protein
MENIEIKEDKVNMTANLKEYMKQYRITNPDKWYKKNICGVCGGKFMTCSKYNHERTKKHLKAVQGNIPPN